MKVFDCFTFYNELDLLEIRLNELNDVVDCFVLVEAEKSHQNKIKPLFFNENKDRYSKFLNKIIHIIVKEEEFNNEAWHNEKLQRNKILNGLSSATDNDAIIVSDLDEIPSKDSVETAIKNNNTLSVFEQILHYYYLNTPVSVYGSFYNYGSVLLKKSQFEQNTEIVRDWNFKKNFAKIQNGGWHFSFLGNQDNAMNKINNYAHTEFNHLDYNTVNSRLENLKDPFGRSGHNLIVANNLNYLPKYVQSNLDRFSQYIKR
jgi:beta-1,4-mannosyl-glycoprotein beta-1,4-N-acetylglucosaminyltransferase